MFQNTRSRHPGAAGKAPVTANLVSEAVATVMVAWGAARLTRPAAGLRVSGVVDTTQQIHVMMGDRGSHWDEVPSQLEVPNERLGPTGVIDDERDCGKPPVPAAADRCALALAECATG